MKLKNHGKRIVNTARIVNRFGNAWLIRRANGRHELIGGTDSDFTAAKEWTSLFAHEVVFSRPTKCEPHWPTGKARAGDLRPET